MKHVFVLSFLLLVSFICQAQGDWKLDKSSDGIDVYTRTKEKTAFKEFKGVTTLYCSVSTFVSIVLDFENALDWTYNILEIKRLKTISPHEHFLYYVIDMPWPLDDRDLVNHLIVTQDKETGVTLILFDCIGDYLPEKKGLVRMEDSKGFYRLTPQADGKLFVEYQYLADPEGIPAWIVNFFITDAPMDTLKKMQKKIEEEKYKNTKLDWIKD